MFFTFNGYNYIGYTDLTLNEMIKKLNKSSFVILSELSSHIRGINEPIEDVYEIGSKCAISISLIEKVKPFNENIELNKNDLKIIFE